MATELTLNRVSMVGTWHAHFYELDGKVLAQECTAAEHAALKVKDAGKPNVPGRWLYTSGPMRRYDTPDGFIGQGNYADIDAQTVAIGVGGDEHQMPKSAVVGDRLSTVPPRLALAGVASMDELVALQATVETT